MKKLVSILLALTMILAMSTTAFAASITISGGADRTYEGYQLLTLTTSLKTSTHPTTCTGTHSEGCYNYSYTVNSKYLTILQNETFTNAPASFWNDTTNKKPVTADGVTEEQILLYLNTLTSDTSTGTLRLAADRIYRAIQDWNKAQTEETKKITPDDKDLSEVAQGYWMIADVTNLTGAEGKANSLVMVDTAGQDNLTITPKTALPSLKKEVLDINNSTDANITDNEWADSADHDIGDAVPFKLTATLPSNLANYETYEIIFHDKLSAGLKLKAESIQVYMYANQAAAAADTGEPESDYLLGGDYFTTTTTGLSEGYTFTVSCDDVTAIPNVTANTVFVVYYEATLEGADVITGSDGNTNEAYLEFSNNAYTDSTGKTAKDTVKVFTYKLVINKVDENTLPLAGAGFTLYKKSALNSHEYIAVGGELKGENMTQFIWKGLDDGDYMLKETTVPDGYNKMEDRYFTITATHTDGDAPALTEVKSAEMGNGDLSTGTITNQITNNTGTVLPSTGAKGTMMLIGGGSLLAMLAAVFMVTRKKMSIYED